LYVNTLDNQFVLDDEPAIVRNEVIRSPAATARQVAASLFSPDAPDPRPLVTATFAWNYAVDGLEPRGYHLLNTLTHVAAALALFGLIRRTLRLPRWGGRFDSGAGRLAFAVALLWLAHPLNTQA